jgi:hypothetical protein
MLIENVETFKVDLMSKDGYGRTGYQTAEYYNKTDVAYLIKKKMLRITS